ncbi:MAG: NAD-dependent epimerase/dehydratase family protein, partial [Pirellulales bacterium]
MKIIVTGGAGFIGSHIVDACLTSGHDVEIIDDLSSGSSDNVPDDIP